MNDLPHSVYEALPYAYVVIGVWAASGLDVSAGRVSGLLLVFAGLTIFRLRIKFRSQGSFD
jgi:hypothetical protein